MPSPYKRSTKPRTKPSGRKAAPTGTDSDLNAMTLSGLFADEDKAREFLESKRWPDGKPFCPHCGSVEAYRLTGRPGSANPVPKGTCKCKACRKKFTVRVGTIYEDSKLPLRYRDWRHKPGIEPGQYNGIPDWMGHQPNTAGKSYFDPLVAGDPAADFRFPGWSGRRDERGVCETGVPIGTSGQRAAGPGYLHAGGPSDRRGIDRDV